MRSTTRGDCSPIGRRIHIMGNTSAGKSTLGTRLAQALDVPFVELDALNWQPGWIGLTTTNPAEFEQRIHEATAGIAGSSRARTPVFRNVPFGRACRP